MRQPKPCPYCGELPIVKHVSNTDTFAWAHAPGFKCPLQGLHDYPTEESAVAGWNARVSIWLRRGVV